MKKPVLRGVVFLLFFTFFIVSCNSPYTNTIPSLLDIDTAKVLKEQVIEDCMFCSEGITIYKIKLDSKTIEKFLNNKTKRFPDSKDRSWCGYGWFTTPINADYTNVFNHLNYLSKKKVEKALLEIKNTLKENDVYYAFYIRHFEKDLDPLEAQIFVLNPRKKTLYIVVSIT